MASQNTIHGTRRPDPGPGLLRTYGLIRGDAGGDGSLGAAVAREASARDLDLIRVGAISPAIGAGGAEGNGGRKGGDEESERAHIGLLGENWVSV